jgi:ferritin-like protein
MASEGFHETDLTEETRDRHRAITSIMEELEAIDWYDQRIDATHDEELKSILAHNRDEEKEHAVMLLEWLGRRDPKIAAELKSRLFRPGPIAVDAHEGEDAAAGGTNGAGDGSLGIGSLQGTANGTPER